MTNSCTETMRPRLKFGRVADIPDQMHLHVGRVTFTLIYPWLIRNPARGSYGIKLDTTVLIHTKKRWSWAWTACVMLLGFGAGVSCDWIENPFRKETT